MAESISTTILLAVDGSSNAQRAFAYLAKRASTDRRLRICVLNVQGPLPPSLFVTRAMIKQHLEAMSKAALKGVRAALARHRLGAAILVRVGDPAQSIVQVAKQNRCAEIVMGTRGLGSIKGLILGSVATKVIHLSKIPVTVVP